MRASRPLAAVLTVVLLGPGCGAVEEPAVVEREAAIIGGTADPGDPAIVALVLSTNPAEGSWLCTGTLISPRVILTAAHCVDSSPQGDVYFGTNVLHLIDDSVEDPGYLGRRSVGATGVSLGWAGVFGVGEDLGLIEMSRSAPDGVAPLPLLWTALSEENLGDPLRLVGYGERDSSSDTMTAGPKLEVTTELSGLFAGEIAYGSSTANVCVGDSGGPALVSRSGSEAVAGVTSWGTAGCDLSSRGVEVAPHRQLIEGWVTAHGGRLACGPDGACPDGTECSLSSGGAGLCLDPSSSQGACAIGGAGASPNAVRGSGTGPAGGLLVLAGFLSRRRRRLPPC